MKYSLIIPLYKIEDVLLKRCLDSVLLTNRQDIEIIIIETLDEKKSHLDKNQLADKRIKYFISDKASVSYQRNMGLDKSSGEYIIFVDGDDFISPQFFDVSDSVIESNADIDLIVFSHLCSSSFLIYDLNDIKYTTLSNVKDFNNAFSSSSSKTFSFEGKSIWSKVYKHKTIKDKDCRFDETLPSTSDHFFNMNFIQNCSSVIIADSYQLYHYEISPISMTPKLETNSPIRYNLLLNAWKELLTKYPTKELFDEYFYNASAVYIPRMLSYYFLKIPDKNTYRLFKQTIKHSDYLKCISSTRYEQCVSKKKRFQLFLLKFHMYRLYFVLFKIIYRKEVTR